MTKSAHFSFIAPVFNGVVLPEEGIISGYAAIIHKLGLPVPLPIPFTVVSLKTKRIENKSFTYLSKSYEVNDSFELSEVEALYRHLVFALKYEGVNLLTFSALIKHYSEEELTQLISIEPTGQYSRRIWFLVEWLMQRELSGISDLSKKSYVDVLDAKQQFGIKGIRSSRQMVNNNLPGTVDFCPLIRRTTLLEQYINKNLSNKNSTYLKGIRKNILQRAAAFLLLKDSKASFTIEGESPKSKRATRWGKAIGQAGMKDLRHHEFERLQQLVIENSRFIDMGYRKKGGFIGERDKDTFSPVPDHISAKRENIQNLMTGLLETNQKLLDNEMDAVLAAASIAFGFVFIHPFADGNGRIHRYLIHHVLAKKQFSEQGLIFPVSASILNHIGDYQKVLERYSMPLLDFIDWKETSDHNVEVTNETIDYYRYFDVTPQAEFLYSCVEDTIENIIPNEVNYLGKYEEFKYYIDNTYEMPDDMVSLLVRFLEQNDGALSKRAKKKEFVQLSKNEIKDIEYRYNLIFNP
ncbi:MAG TPA: Fic family protein [Allomuricauda sp.]|nr:Fic family protein [Allomuricauda sp.]